MSIQDLQESLAESDFKAITEGSRSEIFRWNGWTRIFNLGNELRAESDLSRLWFRDGLSGFIAWRIKSEESSLWRLESIKNGWALKNPNRFSVIWKLDVMNHSHTKIPSKQRFACFVVEQKHLFDRHRDQNLFWVTVPKNSANPPISYLGKMDLFFQSKSLFVKDKQLSAHFINCNQSPIRRITGSGPIGTGIFSSIFGPWRLIDIPEQLAALNGSDDENLILIGCTN